MSEANWHDVEVEKRSHVWIIGAMILSLYLWAGVAGWLAMGRPAVGSDALGNFVLGCMAMLMADIATRKWLLPRVADWQRGEL